jgi:hypothetical protein
VNVEDAYREAFSQLVRDFLSEEARGHRKVLMLLSGVAIVVWAADVRPTRISTLGVDLEPGDTSKLYLALFVAIAYFFLSFVIYAFNDVLRLRDTSRTARLVHRGSQVYFDKHARELEAHHLRLRDMELDMPRAHREPEHYTETERAIEQLEEELEKWTSLSDLLQSAQRFAVLRLTLDFVAPVGLALAGMAVLTSLI